LKNFGEKICETLLYLTSWLGCVEGVFYLDVEDVAELK
jgi:hypothetical protein